MIKCTRVYNNGDRVVELRTPETAPVWVEFNLTYRFGCALFVGSECRGTGYLGVERCKKIEEELKCDLLKRCGAS